jgi:hypothetical protein
MYCPEHLVFKRSWITVYMVGSADIRREFVPLSWWLNPLRYDVIIRSPKRIRINEDGRAAGKFSSWMYTHVRPHLCKYFGIHHRPTSRGGNKRCHHCDVGKCDYYQWREIGETDWEYCDKDWYDHCSKSTEHDARIVKL